MARHSPPHVVLLVQQPLAPRDLVRFGISALLARGYAVSVFDVADMAFPMLTNVREHYRNFSGFDLLVTHTRADLRAAADAMANARLIICHVGAGYVPIRAWPILRRLSASLVPYLVAAPSTPSFAESSGADRAVTKIMGKIINPSTYLDSLLARLPLQWLGLRPPDFVVVPALSSDLGRPLLSGSSQRIPAHVMDYDLYLEEMARPPKPENIAVFIDQNVGFHPDFKSMGMDWFHPGEFYGRLRSFFDRVESNLGLEVVVAAHPRADYSTMPNLFGARRVVYGQTTSLIRNARLAITCYSTAVLQAVAFRKHVLLYASRDLMNYPSLASSIRGQARYFGASLMMIDDGDSADISSFVCDTGPIYESCMRDWIRHPEAPEKPYWDIVLDSLVDAGVLPVASPRPRASSAQAHS